MLTQETWSSKKFPNECQFNQPHYKSKLLALVVKAFKAKIKWSPKVSFFLINKKHLELNTPYQSFLDCLAHCQVHHQNACQLAKNWMEKEWPHKSSTRHKSQNKEKHLPHSPGTDKSPVAQVSVTEPFLFYSATNDSGASSPADTLSKIPENKQLRE